MDPSLLSNRLIVALTGLVAIAAVVVWLIQGDLSVLWSPGHVFLSWALLRELDPDHNWPALTAAAASGVWALTGLSVLSILPVIGLLFASRLTANTTGRRPLPVDLVVVGAFAVATSFTSIGFLAGFAVAIAFYVDDRMAEKHNPASVLASGLTALGASVVATAGGAFPSRIPDFRPFVVTAIGVFALAAILREPETPFSRVDSRKKTPIRGERVHAARTLFAVIVFIAALVAGSEVTELAPMVFVLVLALVANEVERIRRRQ